MVSATNIKAMDVQPSLEHRIILPADLIADAQDYERQGLFFQAGESYQKVSNYENALRCYLRNIDEVASERAIEDAWFGTLTDVLKNDVEAEKLEELCGMPLFHIHDEFHSYWFAAECAKVLKREDVFEQYVRSALNVCLKRAPRDEIYFDYAADCCELLGNSARAAEL